MSDLMGKRIVFIWLLLAFAWVAKSQNYMIKGIVTDSITGEPLPYVAVILKGTTIGATTDLDGAFTLSSSSKVRTLQVSYLGYTEKELKFVPGKAEHLKIQLAPTSINLSEVIIKPGKERYRKKDNPAVTFIKNAIARRESNDPSSSSLCRRQSSESHNIHSLKRVLRRLTAIPSMIHPPHKLDKPLYRRQLIFPAHISHIHSM